MKHKAYKTIAIALAAGIFLAASSFAQTKIEPAKPEIPSAPLKPAVPAKAAEAPTAPFIKWNDKDFEVKMNDINVKVFEKLKIAENALSKIDFGKMEIAMADFGKNFPKQFKNFENLSEADYPEFQGIEKSKIISKSYTVDANDKLAINNQYGTVAITTWAKNEIKIDVEIKAYESSDSKAQELLDNVTITDSKQPNLISFKTEIKRNTSENWVIRKNGKEERRGVRINYIVYMPSKNPLDVINKYGGTNIPNFDGALNINSSYGSFFGKALTNSANKIKVAYGSTVIESLKSGSLDISYGSLKLGSAGRLNADVSYSNANIGKLNEDGILNLKYGGLKIDQIDDNVKNLNVNASYTSVALGFVPNASFNFDVTVSYSGFNYNNDKVKVTSTDPAESSRGFNPTKNYKGTYGNGSGARIIIKSNYGGVKFL